MVWYLILYCYPSQFSRGMRMETKRYDWTSNITSYVYRQHWLPQFIWTGKLRLRFYLFSIACIWAFFSGKRINEWYMPSISIFTSTEVQLFINCSVFFEEKYYCHLIDSAGFISKHFPWCPGRTFKAAIRHRYHKHPSQDNAEFKGALSQEFCCFQLHSLLKIVRFSFISASFVAENFSHSQNAQME